MIKLFAFDIFGTLLDMQHARREDVLAYGTAIRQSYWKPLELPDDWLNLPLFPDVELGWSGCKTSGATIVTLSNAPWRFQELLWDRKCAGRFIDLIVPLEMMGVYKPNLEAYRSLFRLFPHVKPEEMCMVTANKNFGDIEAAKIVGIQSCLIRGDTGKDVASLVEMCG